MFSAWAWGTPLDEQRGGPTQCLMWRPWASLWGGVRLGQRGACEPARWRRCARLAATASPRRCAARPPSGRGRAPPLRGRARPPPPGRTPALRRRRDPPQPPLCRLRPLYFRVWSQEAALHAIAGVEPLTVSVREWYELRVQRSCSVGLRAADKHCLFPQPPTMKFLRTEHRAPAAHIRRNVPVVGCIACAASPTSVTRPRPHGPAALSGQSMLPAARLHLGYN